ncbi:MAG TPA: hypothetical protein VN033_09630 [Vulgatibacter sp.]|nr:hypothetical protein [Vulgatibacter sp.]
MNRLFGWGLAILALAWAAPANAEPKDEPRAPREAEQTEKAEKVIREADKVVVRKKTTVNFNDVRLEGELTGPDGGYVPGREATEFDSLLEPRKDFLQELEKSAEGL